MRIPTAMMFQEQLTMLSMQYERMGILNQQASSGKKLLVNSDDPVLASQINLTSNYLQDVRSYSQSILVAKNRNSLFESSLGDAKNTADKINQLIKAVGSDILSDTERAAKATELKGYLNILLNDANTRDGNGEFIYSGFNTNSQPFVFQGGSYIYQGTYDKSYINIGASATSVYNESGYDVFGDISNGNGTFTVTGASGNTGTASTSSGSVNGNNFISDTYTISFVTNSAGHLAYQVIGASTGQVIPPLPATIPADAPDYVPDSNLTFNGSTLHITGNPNVGDTFTVAPSQKENVFNDINGLINLLNTPIENDPIKRAQFHQSCSQFQATFSNVFDQLNNYQSEIGTRMQIIQSQEKSNVDTLLNQTSIYSALSNIDEAKVITDITQQGILLQATQGCYSMIQKIFMQLLQM